MKIPIQDEMKRLEFQKTNAFKSTPREWIQFKLDNLHKTLKDLLETIALEPVLES